MTKASPLERSDHWVLPLGGEVVRQCRYDYAFTLSVGELDPPFVIRISDAFALHSPDGSVCTLDPVRDPAGMGPTLRLVHSTVIRAIAHKDARLEIDFEDGSLLRLSPSSGYEPWELHGPNNFLMVADTDNELVVWSE